MGFWPSPCSKGFIFGLETVDWTSVWEKKNEELPILPSTGMGLIAPLYACCIPVRFESAGSACT